MAKTQVKGQQIQDDTIDAAVDVIFPTRIVTATETLTINDFVILSNPSTSITLTLPPAQAGLMITVKRINGGVATTTVQGATIDGAASVVLAVQYNSITVVSDGSSWFIV